MGEYLKIVNRELRKVGQSRAEYNGMGATITAAIIRNGRAYLSQVGDSRGYLVRDRKIRQITKDQSLAQALIDIGQLTEESAAHFPNRNIILSALGADDNIEPEISTVDMELGDYLLLCSDGLSNKVSSAEMLNIVLQTQTLHSACEQLIELANINGGEDNITLILARLNGVELPEPDVRSKSLI